MQNPSERLAALDEITRSIVLDLLDEMSRPLGRREIEKTLARQGYTRSERMAIVPAMLRFEIIALVPRSE